MASFEVVDSVISLLIQLGKGAIIEPRINIDTRVIVGRMMTVVSTPFETQTDNSLMSRSCYNF